MSHNVKLEGIVVTDLDILNEAIKKVAGTEAHLDRNAKQFRTWTGQDTKCDAAIILKSGQHDIGLKVNDDGNYEFVFDPYSLAQTFVHEMHKNNLGTCRMMSPGKAIGGLTQEYGLMQSEYTAAMQGYQTERVPHESGRIALEVTM